MAPRRIVADSDDEDDDLSPGKPTPAPDMEPLSPHHQPTSPVVRQPSLLTLSISNVNHDTSGSTDPSFFANVYDDQQIKALQQSHLIESIVRLSQKASGSGEDISLPAKAKGKNNLGNMSSAPNVTSPVVLDRQGPRKIHMAQISEATEVTTPRKSSSKDEWDVPSSGDEGAAPTSGNSSKGRNPKTYGKRKRSDSGQAQENFSTEELEVIDQITTSPQQANKKRRATDSGSDDSAIQDGGNFYVAQSNLSTSQKLQYQKVNVIEDQAQEMGPRPLSAMQPPSNHKSSGATTIAYSTPSRYASSGPRPPWEIGQSAFMQGENAEGAIDLTSSPDAISSSRNLSKVRKSLLTAKVPALGVEDEDEDGNVATSSTRRKRSRAEGDEDELGQDDPLDSDAVGYHRGTLKPRTSRRKSKTAITHGGMADFQVAADDMFVEPLSDLDPEYGETAGVSTTNTSKRAPKKAKSSSTAQDGTQPKRRGRKKKQPVSNEMIQDEEDMDQNTGIGEPTGIIPVLETEPASEKPKKKRGRPRKSNVAANAGNPDQPHADKQATNAGKSEIAMSESSLHDKDSIVRDSLKDVPGSVTRKSENRVLEPKVDTERLKRSASPLTETDRNSLLKSQSTVSEPDKLMSTSVSKPPPSQAGKVLYRVGLSKRLRIAPLLKSLKK
ncbi:hypothetical protein BJ170DRAFT_478807 [Xylariales sp. AK1849]|nr:hypothetical protein BJ170DRAFT_478807 [Xylariales sp. AK1849]